MSWRTFFDLTSWFGNCYIFHDPADPAIVICDKTNMSRADLIYRKILLTKFFTHGWGKPENLKKIFNLRYVLICNSCPFVSDCLFLKLYLSFQTPTKQSHNGSFSDFTPDPLNAGRSHQGRRQK